MAAQGAEHEAEGRGKGGVQGGGTAPGVVAGRGGWEAPAPNRNNNLLMMLMMLMMIYYYYTTIIMLQLRG